MTGCGSGYIGGWSGGFGRCKTTYDPNGGFCKQKSFWHFFLINYYTKKDFSSKNV